MQHLVFFVCSKEHIKIRSMKQMDSSWATATVQVVRLVRGGWIERTYRSQGGAVDGLATATCLWRAVFLQLCLCWSQWLIWSLELGHRSRSIAQHVWLLVCEAMLWEICALPINLRTSLCINSYSSFNGMPPVLKTWFPHSSSLCTFRTSLMIPAVPISGSTRKYSSAPEHTNCFLKCDWRASRYWYYKEKCGGACILCFELVKSFATGSKGGFSLIYQTSTQASSQGLLCV
jgi:hypothetical protein